MQQLSTAYKTHQVYWASMDSLEKPHLQDAQYVNHIERYLLCLKIIQERLRAGLIKHHNKALQTYGGHLVGSIINTYIKMPQDYVGHLKNI